MSRDNGHDPRAIANRILDMRTATGEPLSLMQLIKLVYIADGWSLALLNKPLASEAPQAWQYGPVFRSVYTSFAGIGANPVTSRAKMPFTNLPYNAPFSNEEENLLGMVVRGYGKLSAFALSNLTHQPNTPWSNAYSQGLYSDIDAMEMRSHFLSLRENRLVHKQ